MEKAKQIIVPPYFTKAKINRLAKIIPVPIDRVLLFYSYLMHRNINQADKKGYSFKETRISPFHRVHSNLLRIIFGRSKYKTVMDILVANQLLEIDQSYCTGFQNEQVNMIGYPKAYKIPNKLVSKKYEKCRLKRELLDGHTINAKAKLLDYIRAGKINNIQLPENIKGLLLDSIDNLDPATLPKQKETKLSSGSSMCRFGNRLHTCITNLKKVSRQDLRFKGSDEFLIEIDISTSQMYFFANLRMDLVEQVLIKSDADKVTEKINNLLGCSGFLQFKNAVLYGDKDIYQKFADKFEMERDRAKKIILTIFFGSQHINLQQEKDYFERRFPGLLEQINSLKTIRISGSEKKHANLALILQRIESKMVLEKSIVAAAELGINDILTIHDSWLIKESQVGEFESMLKPLFISEFNTVPKFKTKGCGASDIEDKKKELPVN